MSEESDNRVKFVATALAKSMRMALARKEIPSSEIIAMVMQAMVLVVQDEIGPFQLADRLRQLADQHEREHSLN